MWLGRKQCLQVMQTEPSLSTTSFFSLFMMGTRFCFDGFTTQYKSCSAKGTSRELELYETNFGMNVKCQFPLVTIYHICCLALSLLQVTHTNKSGLQWS